MPGGLDPQWESQQIEAARKDITAIQEMYEYYFPKVFAYVSYRIGGVAESEDLVSAIFLKVIEQLEQFHWQGDGSFAAWLFRIAHDRVVDYYRRNQTDHKIIPLEELPELAFSTLLPLDQVLQKEKLAYMRWLIGSLSPRRQEIITLKFFGGLRNAEIAQVLGLDERTVASHLCRGLADLHRLYKETFFQREGEVSHE